MGSINHCDSKQLNHIDLVSGSLRVDSNDDSHIAYISKGKMMYAFKHGSWAWQMKDLGTAYTAAYPMLAIDSGDHPAILYYAPSEIVTYASRDASGSCRPTPIANVNTFGFNHRGSDSVRRSGLSPPHVPSRRRGLERINDVLLYE